MDLADVGVRCWSGTDSPGASALSYPSGRFMNPFVYSMSLHSFACPVGVQSFIHWSLISFFRLGFHLSSVPSISSFHSFHSTGLFPPQPPPRAGR